MDLDTTTFISHITQIINNLQNEGTSRV